MEQRQRMHCNYNCFSKIYIIYLDRIRLFVIHFVVPWHDVNEYLEYGQGGLTNEIFVWIEYSGNQFMSIVSELVVLVSFISNRTKQ